MNDIPKAQIEQITTSQRGFGSFYSITDYFVQNSGMPYYSSYVSLLNNNSLVLLLNDHQSNNVVAGYGDRVKTIYNFRKKSNVYGVAIDIATGKITKKMIAENTNDAILMPRNALVVGGDVFVPSWRMHALAKTQLKFAKISVK
jgi:hypothetical protein